MQNEHLWNKGLKVPSNEHLQKNRGGGVERGVPGSLGGSGKERGSFGGKKVGGEREAPGNGCVFSAPRGAARGFQPE